MTATKTLYQTDANGIYVGKALAYESPLEPGTFLIPAGCVAKAPPTAPKGKVQQWNGASWVLAPAPAPKPGDAA